MVILSYALGGYDTGDISLPRTILGNLHDDDLLVGDCHFAGANLYCEYLRSGLQFLMQAHQRLRIDRLKRVEVFAENDFVGKLTVGKKCRQTNPLLPSFIHVRVIGADLSNLKETPFVSVPNLCPCR